MGCKHYERKCKIQAPCCQEFFDCRLCHNDTQDHAIDRFKIETVLCSECQTKQPKANTCAQCGVQFANHFCGSCNLWCEDPIYHCQECGICYKIPPENRKHCPDCNLCFETRDGNVTLKDHRCSKKKATQGEECCVCLEELYYGVESSMFTLCGHGIHSHCFEKMLQNGDYKCPLCKKTMIDMDWKKLEDLIQKYPVNPPVTTKEIYCNDCLQKSTTEIHPFGNKCAHCLSFNTTF